MALTADLNPDAISIGTARKSGLYIAPVGTARPAKITDEPATPWQSLGYLSEDGVKWSQSTDNETVMTWQSRSPVRSFITKRELMAEFTLLELSERNFQLYFSQKMNAAPNAGIEFDLEIKSDSPAYTYALLMDVQDGDTITRLYFPRASLSDAGDMEVTQSGAIGLPVTMSAQDDNGTLSRVQRGSAVAPKAAGA